MRANLQELSSFSIPSLSCNSEANAFVAFKRRSVNVFPEGVFKASLKFVSKDCDPETGEADQEGYEDLYQVNLHPSLPTSFCLFLDSPKYHESFHCAAISRLRPFILTLSNTDGRCSWRMWSWISPCTYQSWMYQTLKPCGRHSPLNTWR